MWRQVPSVPELEANADGFVRVKPYLGPLPNGGLRSYGGKARRGSWDGNRYIIFVEKLAKTFRVARLVCEAFHGPAPEGLPNTLHRDEDSRNNRPENLYWGTQQENLNAPGFIAYCRGRTGDNNPYRKGRRVPF